MVLKSFAEVFIILIKLFGSQRKKKRNLKRGVLWDFVICSFIAKLLMPLLFSEVYYKNILIMLN